MKTFLRTIFLISFLVSGAIAHAQSTCQETASNSGSDSGPTSVTFTSFPCTGGGAITGITLTTANTSGNCGTWYDYTISVTHSGGTETVTGQCNVTATDLATFNGATINVATITNITISSNDLDAWSDNVTVNATVDITYTPPPCSPPNTLTTANITTTTADLGWTENNTPAATSWNIEYSTTSGFASGTGTTVVASSNPYTLTGLTANTTYYYTVQADCGGSGQSAVSVEGSFATPCPTISAVTLPFLEDFESNNGTFIGSGNIVCGTDRLWSFSADNNTYGRVRIGTDAHSVSTGNGAATLDVSTNGNFVTNYFDLTLDLSNYTTVSGQLELSFDFADFGDEVHPEDRVWIRGSNTDTWLEIYDWTTYNNSAFTTISGLNISGLLSANGQSVSSTFQVRFGQYDNFTTPDDGLGIDNIKIELITCPQPSNLTITNLTPTSADLGWTAGGSETMWNIEYSTTAGFTSGSGTTVAVSSNPYILTGLTDNTTYYFTVQADCGGGDLSNPSSEGSFTTSCTPFTAPYSQNFDAGNTGTPFSGVDCWRTTGPGANDVYLVTSTDDGVTLTSSPNVVELNDGALPADSAILVSPEFSDLPFGNNRIKFQAHQEGGGSSDLHIGVMTDPDDAATFVLIQTITSAELNAASGFEEYRINMDNTGLIGSAKHIAFMHGTGVFELYVDDFEYEAIPPCLEPTNVSTTNITMTSATLNWTAGNTPPESSWNIEYSTTANFTPGTGAGTVITASFTPYNLIGLTPNTNYYYYIQADCGTPDGTSAWVGPYSFYTGYCQVSSTNPNSYFDDFTTTGGSTNISNTGSGYATNGYQDATSMVVSQYATGSVNFNTTLVGTTVGVAIWVDWNNDLIFDNATERMYNTGTYVSTASGSITVPAGTPVGDYRMRIICDYNATNPSACSPNARSETEDYTFTVIPPPPCLPPAALIATNVTTTSATLSWTDNNTTTPSSWNVEYSTANFTPGTGVGTAVTATSNPFPISGLTPNTTYYYYVQSDCGATDGTSDWSVTPYSFFTGYCQVSSTNPNSYFDDFTTTNGSTNISNTGSGYATNGYQDATNMVVSQFATGSINFNTTLVGTTVGVAIWVDWNNDLVFDNATEREYNTAGYVSSASGTIMVPAGTPVGDYRMRIVCDYNATSPSACSPLSRSETEDYTFRVTASPLCFPPTNLTATNITATSADLSWMDNNTTPPTGWEIEWGPTGFAPGGGGTTVSGVMNPHTLTGLSGNTTYDYYVNADCGTDGTSLSTGPYTFTTLCAPFTTLPYTHTFDAYTPNNNSLSGCQSGDNIVGNCWVNDANNSNNWVARSTSTVSTNTGPSAGQGGSGNYVYVEASSCSSNTSDLYSPSFDLTGISNGILNFWYHMYGSDMGSLDVAITTDGGATWTSIVSVSGDQGNSWQESTTSLNAYANQTVGFRFRATTGTSFNSDIAIDQVTVDAVLDDVGVTAVSAGNCTSTETVTITIKNFGPNKTHTSIPVTYSVNGGTPVTETWTGSLPPNVTTQYTFNATFDASATGNYVIAASTALPIDVDNTNNNKTVIVTSGTIYPTTFLQTFESGLSLPPDWSVDGGVTNGHNAPSNVIFDNLNSSDSTFTATLPKIGNIVTNDELRFAYRYVNVGGGDTTGTTLGSQDALNVQISTDCGQTFTTIATINSANHTPSNKMKHLSYDLSAYNGQPITPRIYVVRRSGNYYIDLDDFYVGQPLGGTTTESAAVSCNGGNDGAIMVTGANGVTPYSYQWDAAANNQTTAIATGLSAGTYSVTITDAQGFTYSTTHTLTEPTMVMASAAASGAISCNGGSDGKAMASGTGGTGAYTYQWDAAANNQTTQEATGLSAGVTYSVTVTDANMCSAIATVMLTEPTMVMASATVSGAVSCNGGNDGKAMANGTGGTGAYTYMWDAAANNQTTQEATGLSAGITYSVTVTDANMCPSVATVTLTEPTMVMASAMETAQATCGGNDGKAMATGTGGTAPYTYLWDAAANNQTTQEATGLATGVYSVTVYDANNCEAAATVTVTTPSTLATSTVPTHLTCNGAGNGSIVLTVTGGVPTYSYSWSNGAATKDISGLAAGTYTVTVTDGIGCDAVESVVITEPAMLVATGSESMQVTCNGNSDGKATVNVTGGTGAYTYLWDAAANNQTTQEATGLTAGTYTVTVTDANGCTMMGTAVVTEPAMLAASTSTTNITCNGANNGMIDLTVTGGTSPYTYQWSNSMMMEDLSGLGVGTYNVTVTDARGCMTTAQAMITEPAVLMGSLALGQSYNGFGVSCSDATDGAINLTVTGGTAAYTYAWSNGATTQNISGLGAGQYSVTITDANNCTTTQSLAVTAPPVIAVSASTNLTHNGFSITCNGASDGVVVATASGGVGTYIYEWFKVDNGTSTLVTGANTATVTGLSAGTYRVKITDINNCTATANVDVTEPTVLSASAAGTNVNCNGASDGTVSVTPMGGVAPYTYEWNNNAITATIGGLSGGTYNVTVTDANGCTTTASSTITEPTILGGTATATMVSCFGGANGTATAAGAGGTSPYTYAWSNNQSMATITGLMAGTYTVTITDANNCTVVQTTTVNQPTAVVASGFESQPMSCNGGIDGKASVNATGGTAPYTYQWDAAANNQTTQEASNLMTGTYSVTVTDANGCTATSTATVTTPSGIAVAVNATDISCNGINDGFIDITVTGGDAPFTYSWSNGATTEDIMALSDGSYAVTVTDSNGCLAFGNASISRPSALVITSIVPTHITCAEANDGSIDISVTGGTAPYTYLWLNGATTEDATNLDVGTYSVVVTDANGCTVTAQATVNEPAPLVGSLSLVQSYQGFGISCNGQTDGAIDLSVNGGTMPYTYVWSNMATTQDIAGLGAGQYSVTITDANNCSTVESIMITEPTALSTTADTTLSHNGYSISCNGGSDGVAIAMPAGGVAPYIYEWDTMSNNMSSPILGATNSVINGLAAGTYSVKVTDANGCTAMSTVAITEPTMLGATAAATDVTCNGVADGTASVTATGGVAPYTYSWNTGGTMAMMSGLSGGTYTVVVTDANGCTVTTTTTVAEPTALTATAMTSNITCNSLTDGSVDLMVTGGTAPYTYAWDNTATTEDLSGLGAGTYNVVVTDANGCTATASATITEPFALGAIANPTAVSCNGGMDGSIALTVAGGTAPFTYAWSNSSTSSSLGNLMAGTYDVTITDVNGCTATVSATVGEPTVITATSSVTNTTCNGSADGSINLSATGGTGAYTYAWSNGATTQNVANLSAGTYVATVTDANGCTTTHTAVVTEPMAMVAAGTVSNVTCNGGSDGSITMGATGGTAPYTYAWSNNATGMTLSNAAAGSYSVTVTDANGCSTTSTFTITQPTLIALTASGSNIACNGGTGSLMAQATGGTGTITITWTDAAGATVSNPSSVGAGTYTATATDANGCTTNSTVTITEAAPMSVTTTNVSDVRCAGEANGSIQVAVTGGTGPYTYTWSDPNLPNNSMAQGLTVGNYSVTVTDFNGCTATANATINEPGALSVTVAGGDDPNNAGKVEVTATVTGGTAPFNYAWSGNAGGQTGSTISGVSSGVYSVVVTDANGCSTEGTVTVIATNTSAITGIEKVQVFPNPTSSQATINIELSEAADIGITIYNIAGQQVAEFGNATTMQQRHTIDVSTYAAGVYLVRFRVNDQIITKRLVVAKN